MDAGEELVAHMFREMRIDHEWAVREPRGFTWWAGGLAQRVWAESPVEDFGETISRVHARTDVLRSVPAGSEAASRIAATAGFSTMSGPLLGDGSLQSAASVFVHDGTLGMWKRLFTFAALIQVTAAHIDVAALAELTGGQPAMSAHPVSGFRPEPDEMLNVIRDVFAPMGAPPSAFVGADFREGERLWGSGASVLTTADESGLTSEFPWGTRTALLQMMTDVPNPRLGNGLLVVLTLPTRFPEGRVPDLVLELNRRELAELTRAPFLGSWCQHASLPDCLSFVSFLPNVCAAPGLPGNLLLYFATRAKWVLEVAGGDLETSRNEARPAFLRWLRS